MKIKHFTFITGFIWLFLVSLSFYWNYQQLKQERELTALSTAKSFFSMVDMMRDWNSGHVVYVAVNDTTKPNPYIKDNQRDITAGDMELTMMNPAYMTREISDISFAKEGVKFHITSLNLIRKANGATELEAEALREFEKGVPEKGMFITEGTDKGKYFYMAPLVTAKSCLKCHIEQGYKVGEIRGGISITMPFSMKIPSTLLTGHILIGLIGLAGLVTSGRKVESAYEKLRRQAMFDSLTGIPNRQYFNTCFEQELRRCKREKEDISVIMCDIDSFKTYNDSYGHIKGDECLKTVARSIENSLSRPADFCARFGGEEFVIILPNTSSTGAEHMAEKIRKTIEGLNLEHSGSEHGGVVTASFGVTTAEAGNFDVAPEHILKTADTALYNAKKSGRNRVSFTRHTPENV
ncbi:diguanylate cyclase [Desulfovibrio sp. Huiquan2017]|uniref:diguanylate cyclase n=1 Tax=Desulfovibrio sp. Huiquan2017 TaxID=2816861 RepID=UPI001A9130B5